MIRARRILVMLAALLAPLVVVRGGASAIEAESEAPLEIRGANDEAEVQKRSREAELETIRRSLEVSEKRQESLRAEIEGIEDDRAQLNADLIATAQRLRQTEEKAAATEARLEELHTNEEAIRRSLRSRRGLLADILVALQRMGRTPPPAILSRPEDALAAIRGSILAGAVLPDLRVEAEALAADLAELTELTARIETEREALKAEYASLGEERTRIALLVETKQAQSEQTAQALSAEQAKASDLAAQAKSVEGLVAALENEIAAAAKAAADAERASKEVTAPESDDEARRRLADTSRIAPAVPFANAKGMLTMPVAGDPMMRFGEPDGLGGTAEGISLAASPGTPVLAPADGWVVYAGPFRSYGQVLILNAGDGYHVVMAGMERTDAALGQFVLAGEPIALMGATRLASIGEFEHTSAQPVLYVEFRKDGNAIDSAPWWPHDNRDEVRG